MQSTLAEHRRSEHRTLGCNDCHMPIVGDAKARRRSHAFPGAYDPAMLARSVVIESERIDRERVRLILRPGEVGHAVPTGDLLRRLAQHLLERHPPPAFQTHGERLAERGEAAGQALGVRGALAGG